MSFSLKISAKDQATGRFKGRVNRELVKAVVEAKRERNLTRTQIADKMGVDKSTVSRIMKGQGNLTLKTIGDISWVLGLRPDISFSEVRLQGRTDRANRPAMRAEGNLASVSSLHSTSSNKATFSSPRVAVKSPTSPSQNEGLILAN